MQDYDKEFEKNKEYIKLIIQDIFPRGGIIKDLKKEFEKISPLTF